MRIALTLIAALIAGGAHALSCIPPDAARSYQEAAASETRYTMVVGRLSYDKGKLPKVDWNRQQDVPPVTEVPARLEGRSIQADGFTGQWARNITLRVLCFGPWCAGGPGAEETLVFVNLDTTPPSAEIGPCGGNFFAADRETLRRVLACHTGALCDTLDVPYRRP